MYSEFDAKMRKLQRNFAVCTANIAKEDTKNDVVFEIDNNASSIQVTAIIHLHRRHVRAIRNGLKRLVKMVSETVDAAVQQSSLLWPRP